MIVTDTVTCEGCGAEITHLVTAGCGSVNLPDDPDYRICESCLEERDAEDEQDDFDPENIYNLPSVRQSVEEDRARRR